MAGMGYLRRLLSSTRSLVITGTKAAFVTFLTLNYVGGFVVCKGPSMQPTLFTNDILLTEHISPILGRIDIGDVVVVKSPMGDNRCICKRVVAGPGDIVLFQNRTLTVPRDHIWLEGDNKGNSNDSRYFGPIPMSQVRRRCYCKIFPELDLDLDTPSRFYLESSPSSRQRDTHLWNESRARQKLMKDKQQSEENGLKSDSSSDKFDRSTFKDWFPAMEEISDKQSRSNNDNGTSSTPSTVPTASSSASDNHLNEDSMNETRAGTAADNSVFYRKAE